MGRVTAASKGSEVVTIQGIPSRVGTQAKNEVFVHFLFTTPAPPILLGGKISTDGLPRYSNLARWQNGFTRSPRPLPILFPWARANGGIGLAHGVAAEPSRCRTKAARSASVRRSCSLNLIVILVIFAIGTLPPHWKGVACGSAEHGATTIAARKHASDNVGQETGFWPTA